MVVSNEDPIKQKQPLVLTNRRWIPNHLLWSVESIGSVGGWRSTSTIHIQNDADVTHGRWVIPLGHLKRMKIEQNLLSLSLINLLCFGLMDGREEWRFTHIQTRIVDLARFVFCFLFIYLFFNQATYFYFYIKAHIHSSH